MKYPVKILIAYILIAAFLFCAGLTRASTLTLFPPENPTTVYTSARVGSFSPGVFIDWYQVIWWGLMIVVFVLIADVLIRAYKVALWVRKQLKDFEKDLKDDE